MTQGATYKLTWRCPQCNVKNTVELPLGSPFPVWCDDCIKKGQEIKR